MSVQPLPITGIAACNALGASLSEIRSALYEGRCALTSPPASLALPFGTVVGAVDIQLPELPPQLTDWSTRTNRFAALLVSQLERELARMRRRWAPERIAVLMGTSTAGADVTENAYRAYLKDGVLPPGYDLFKHHTYGSVLHVIRELSGARGPAWVISTACTSSAKPLASAQRLIRAGVIDAAIVGGIDTLCAMTLRGFHALEALSAHPCKPFAADRDGLNIGEGGAFMLLEREAQESLAHLLGVGESSDAYHVSAPHPEGAGARLAMERALAQANCVASDVEHINAHGTGTPLNDRAEAKAIASLFHDEVPVVSTKSYTGHMLGAAGVTEAVFAVLAVLEQWIPASLRSEPRDPTIDINVTSERMQGRFRRVLSNCFAFGGNNISVLVGGSR